MNEGDNPEFNPTGIEGGIDTNALPWIELSQAPGMAIKPLRASIETGVFTVVVRLRKGTELSGLVYLGAMDMMVMAGTVQRMMSTTPPATATTPSRPGRIISLAATASHGHAPAAVTRAAPALRLRRAAARVRRRPAAAVPQRAGPRHAAGP